MANAKFSMIRSVGTVGGMTLFSRISGLVRDIAFAQFLGSGAIADAFFVAFRIPNFFRRIFGEGALSVAFVPVYSEFETRYPESETKAFLDLMAGRLGAVLMVFTIIGVVGAPVFVQVMAPGFSSDPEKFEATVVMLRWTFPYLFFISMVALAAGILNTHNRFAAAAATPILLNVCLIVTVCFFVPANIDSSIALGVGVLIAGIIQFAFQFPFLKRVSRIPSPRLLAKDKTQARGAKGVKQVMTLMVPAIFGVSIAQINLLINTVLASFLVTGSVSWLYYSDRLMEFPLGVFGVALATVILPSLSRHIAENQERAYSETLNWALKLVFLVCLPAAVGLALLAFPLIVTLFNYGAFSDVDAAMSARSLAAFSIGLVGFVAVKVLAPGFYARKNTKTPVAIGAVAMAVNAVVALSLIWHFDHVGLALATSIAGLVNASLLFWQLKKVSGFLLSPEWPGFLFKVLISVSTMGLVLLWGVPENIFWLHSDVFQRITSLTFWIVIGSTVYVLALYLCRLPVHRFFEREKS
ncbi:murein biosynthesis integral membrane protein MurJ [Arenicellales bacterium nBUS_45]